MAERHIYIFLYYYSKLYLFYDLQTAVGEEMYQEYALFQCGYSESQSNFYSEIKKS